MTISDLTVQKPSYSFRRPRIVRSNVFVVQYGSLYTEVIELQEEEHPKRVAPPPTALIPGPIWL